MNFLPGWIPHSGHVAVELATALEVVSGECFDGAQPVLTEQPRPGDLIAVFFAQSNTNGSPTPAGYEEVYFSGDGAWDLSISWHICDGSEGLNVSPALGVVGDCVTGLVHIRSNSRIRAASDFGLATDFTGSNPSTQGIDGTGITGPLFEMAIVFGGNELTGTELTGFDDAAGHVNDRIAIAWGTRDRGVAGFSAIADQDDGGNNNFAGVFGLEIR